MTQAPATQSAGFIDEQLAALARLALENPVTGPTARALRLTPTPRHSPPRPARMVLATVVAVVGSILADAILVAAGRAMFPSTQHYAHFRFMDYTRLTVVGVLAACVAWPIVVRVTTTPRWLFVRLAILVTFALWLPDAFILWQGQPASAVSVLIVMHLAIAVVTYQALVRIAPAGPSSRPLHARGR